MSKGNNNRRTYAADVWEEVILLVMLLGIAPGIYDYSLFFLNFNLNFFEAKIGLLSLIAFLSLPFLIFVCLRRNERTHLMGFLPFFVFFSLQFVPLLFGEWEATTNNLVVQWSVRLAFIYYLFKGHVRGWSFLVFLLIIWFGMSFLRMLMFMGTVLILRGLIELVRQNWGAIKHLGGLKLMGITLRALLLWAPMLLIVVPSFMLSKQMEKQAFQAIYDNTFLEECSQPRNFELDLSISLHLQMEILKDTAHNRVLQARNASEEARAGLPKGIGDLIRSSIIPPEVKIRKSCKWYQLGCHLGKGAAKAAAAATRTAFISSGNALASNAEQTVQGIMNEADTNIDTRLDSVDAKIDEIIDDTEEKTYNATINVYWLIFWILFIMDLLFLFVVIKSFTYVLARVLFSKEKGTQVTLAEPGVNMQSGSIIKTGKKYTIAAQSRKDYYVSRKYEPAGRAPKISWPQFTKCALRRIFNGVWTMNHVVMEEGRSAVHFMAPGGREFVEWTLAPGEVVIFNFRDFVAMSEEVKLSTLISLRLNSLLLGRFIFTTAKGPGKLILSSKGNPVAGTDRAALNSVPESRILAWQQNTRFNVESELNTVDVFFSGVYLKKEGSDLVIIDSDQTGKAKSGIVKFAIHFLLPA